jgi:putative transcriptional regulator
MKNNVRSLRSLRHLSQPLLAARVGVTSTCVDAIEKGRFIPSVQLAYRIASVLAASILEVFPPELSHNLSITSRGGPRP